LKIVNYVETWSDRRRMLLAFAREPHLHHEIVIL
jgi:hypothetical protein